MNKEQTHLVASPSVVALDVDGVFNHIKGFLDVNFLEAGREAGLSTGPIETYIRDIEAGVVRFIGGVRDIARAIWPGALELQIELFVQCFREQEELNPYPPCREALEALDILCLWGVHVFLVSSNETFFLRRRIQLIGINPRSITGFSTRECGYAKPHPGVLNPIYEHQKVRPGGVKLYYAGDWHDDHQLARNANALYGASAVEFFAVNNGFIPPEAFVREGLPRDRIFPHLLAVVKSWGF